tara:strand:- start:128 stop:367 length:240 start_codon:yes stop_codon:yes gene_type:complete
MRIKLEKDKPPFKGAIQIYSEGAVVQNRFGGDSIELNALELSIYDTIMGCELGNKYDEMQRGIDWFIKFNPKAYMVLLD